MPKVHSVGQWYVHSLRYPTTQHPFVERGSTQEVTWPFRRGVSLVVRVPFTTLAFAVGFWQPNSEQEEHTALLQALNGRELGDLATWPG